MSDRDPIPAIYAKNGDPKFARVMDIMAAMLSAAAGDQKRDELEPSQHTAMTTAAAGVLAGYLSGAMIAIGTARDADKKRMGAMLLTNFRQGVTIGKNQALLSMTEGKTSQ